MLYVVRMLFLGLALLIAARPGLDNPGCYRDGWDFFRGICEGITFVLILWALFSMSMALVWYVAASGICSIYCWMPYVGALSQYIRTPQYIHQGTEMHFFVLHNYYYIYFKSLASSVVRVYATMYSSLAAMKCGCIPVQLHCHIQIIAYT